MATDRIHGPYKHRNRWRVFEVAANGTREVVSFESEREAVRYINEARKVASGLSLGDAVTAYLEFRGAPSERGRALRGSTLSLERWRLVGLLRLDESDRPLSSLTRAVARGLFEKRADEVKPDTLAGELATVGRAARWWVGKGHLPSDPFEGLVVRGERSAGKPQLRIDEARAFLKAALDEGTPEGTAVALALITGMRASEITGLTAHDVDDGGRVLWVADNGTRRLKTMRSARRLEVPELLRPRLLALKGETADQRLFGDVDRHWLSYHVHRIAKAAKVPDVSPHGLRGTWATLAVSALPTEHVAAALGHLPEVTRSSYAQPGAEQSRDARALADVLQRETALATSSPTTEPGSEPGPN